jgi:hypothetical protein
MIDNDYEQRPVRCKKSDDTAKEQFQGIGYRGVLAVNFRYHFLPFHDSYDI